MTEYYAFDMANGTTVIGRKLKNRLIGDPNALNLEEVVVVETETNRKLLPSGQYKYIDIKKEYINIYRDVFKNKKFELPFMSLECPGDSKYNAPWYTIMKWHLGEDILKEEKKTKGDI